MSTTVTVQIGNSDDKLSQREWSRFVDDLREVLEDYAGVDNLHFSGGAPSDAAWQNWCVVFELSPAPPGMLIARHEDQLLKDLRADLSYLALRYRQDSIAMTIGRTEMIEP